VAIRLLAVADIHGRTAAIQAIQSAVNRYAPDAVIVAGDLTSWGDAAEVQRVLDSLPGRVLAIPGNLDVQQAFAAGIAGSHAESLVGKGIAIHGVTIAGLFDQLTACDVLVVHEPPRGILDDVGGGRNIGIPDHLAALNRLQPKVLLCGHCHESPGVVAHGSTAVVNCTLGSGGHGALVEVDGDQVAARLL
jgi:Icc-related predicted phosphoesterase